MTRENERDDRKFSAMLKKITAKYGIRNMFLASSLNVTSQYISKLLNGKNLPSREQMEELLIIFEKQGVTLDERRSLISTFVEDKTGFFYEIANLEFAAKSPLEKKLLCDFRLLSSESKKKTLAFINELLIESL